MAGSQKSKGISAPVSRIEIDGEKIAIVVSQQRIDPSCLLSSQMVVD